MQISHTTAHNPDSFWCQQSRLVVIVGILWSSPLPSPPSRFQVPNSVSLETTLNKTSPTTTTKICPADFQTKPPTVSLELHGIKVTLESERSWAYARFWQRQSSDSVDCKTLRHQVNWQNIVNFIDVYFPVPSIQSVCRTYVVIIDSGHCPILFVCFCFWHFSACTCLQDRYT